MGNPEYLLEGPIPESYLQRESTGRPILNRAGAHAFFLGQVRDDVVDGKTVAGIEYSAYAEMVAPVVEAIRGELFNEFPDLLRVDILHSTGLVKCGEISLFVGVSSGHRKQSFAALEKCVDLIKERLPVWKKELFTDGTSRWIQ
jgi:molybdopterin synthase catalytic subunit